MSLVALCANHCMVVLVDCKNYIVSRGFKNVVTFGDVARHAFGRTGLIIVDGLLIFTQIGVCVVYLGKSYSIFLETEMIPNMSTTVYISQNLSALLENYLDFRWFMLMWLPLLILASWIRSLKNVAPLTTGINPLPSSLSILYLMSPLQLQTSSLYLELAPFLLHPSSMFLARSPMRNLLMLFGASIGCSFFRFL